MAKKGKKGKKDKGGPAVPEVVTTREIVRERERMMCPRLGDASERAEKADSIRMECVFFKLRRCVLRGLETLDLSRSNLGSVPEELGLPELGSITCLDLSRNQLFGSDAVFAVLGALRGLRKLDLSNNFLNGPLSDRSTQLLALEDLNLDSNQLTHLPQDAGQWQQMRRFSASKNMLCTLPESCTEWRCVSFVNVRNNKLKALPSVAAWAKLETLYLGSNELAALPEGLEGCAALSELDARSNQLTHLSPALAGCVALRKLHLGNNKITSVPAEILAALVDVEELHLYKNKLDSLPDEVGRLTKCKRMTLSSNNIRTLPDSIADCAALAELYINNCAKFQNLPSSAGDLANLQELQAKKCPALKQLPATAIGWTSLKELDLRAAKKQVCKLPPELISTLESSKCIIRGGVQKKSGGKKGKKK